MTKMKDFKNVKSGFKLEFFKNLKSKSNLAFILSFCLFFKPKAYLKLKILKFKSNSRLDLT